MKNRFIKQNRLLKQQIFNLLNVSKNIFICIQKLMSFIYYIKIYSYFRLCIYFLKSFGRFYRCSE